MAPTESVLAAIRRAGLVDVTVYTLGGLTYVVHAGLRYVADDTARPPSPHGTHARS